MIKNNSRPQFLFRYLALLCALVLSACDGGIFGTGGADEMILTDNNISGQISSEADSTIDQSGNSLDTSDEIESSNGIATGNEVDPSGNSDANIDGDTAPLAPTSENAASSDNDGVFINNNVALDNNAIGLRLYNATQRTVNVFDTRVVPEQLLFAADGIAPNSLSETTNLTNNSTSISFVDTNDVGTSLLATQAIEVANSTLTMIVLRQNADVFDSLRLITQTTTSDPMLARIRVIRAGTLGDARAAVNVRLISSGDNPGGIDTDFEVLSFEGGSTDYFEVPAGQYALDHDITQLTTELLSFTGGVVYSILLVGDGTNTVELITDSPF